ncbi:hypothetical protein DPEC_G00226980 [Dallia pectoralis]|uniref:Uncharacterized protein n=1 Tax=Dallia pectoralis TaxID=75939 RepID=A0ACC2G130_DALPE|nr:hypothetical protein DPEC_G00226980 [Dallia pectoralis]
MTWSLSPYINQGWKAAERVTSGSRRHADALAKDIASIFHMFITPAFERILLEMTGLEGSRKNGDNWKRKDEIDLRANVELLMLADVYGRQDEAICSLW